MGRAISPLMLTYERSNTRLRPPGSIIGPAVWPRPEGIYRQVLAQVANPSGCGVHGNLGRVLVAQGRRDEAIDAYRQAIVLKADDPVLHANLGAALYKAGRHDEAIDADRRAIALKGEDEELCSNLGVALHETGRSDEAIGALARAIEFQPSYARAHNNLGCVLHDLGRLDEAIAAYRRAIKLRPDAADGHTNLGSALCDVGWLDAAVATLTRAIALDPHTAEAHANLGTAYLGLGRHDEAIASFRRAVDLKPGSAREASKVLFALHYQPDTDARALLAEHCRWARQHAEPLAAHVRRHSNDRTPDRKLRVGFLSPDFCGHPVGRLLRPLFAHHDRNRARVRRLLRPPRARRRDPRA